MRLRRPTILRTRRRAPAGALLIALLLAGSLAGTGRARAADASGGATCSARVAGQDLGSTTATVDQNGHVTVTGTGPGLTNEVSVRYAGFPVATQTVTGGSATVSVSDYASAPGLYQLVWESLDTSCKIEGAVRVEGGSFLGTPLGWASAGTIGLALPLLLALGWKTTINPRGRWKLKAAARGDLKRDDDGWRFRWGLAVMETLFGTLLGLLLGGATLATLAGTATSVPTVELALQLTIPLTAIGFLIGLGRLRRPRERGTPVRVALDTGA